VPTVICGHRYILTKNVKNIYKLFSYNILIGNKKFMEFIMKVIKNFFCFCMLIFFFITHSVIAKTFIQPQNPLPNLSLLKEAMHSINLAGSFLIKNQMDNGSWKNDPAITSLVLYALLLDPLYNPNQTSEKAISKGLAFVEQFVKPDGGIYRKEYRNYVTSVCLLAFTESNLIQYKDIIKNAKNFLITFQVDEGEGFEKSHPYYGGIGYGGDDRPDLSNTQFALDAIKAAENFEARFKGIPETIEKIETEEKQMGLHWKKALVFLSRCQNVKQVNQMPYAIDDGGFIYETGTYKKERSHSYGSMTYAGVKSLLHANIQKSDIRLQKAVKWISNNYTLEENPGFGSTSLYYYYMTFAKCLHILDEDIIIDQKHKKHDWRTEYLKKLISLQHEEGYWLNSNGRFYENVKVMVTAYSVIGSKFALNKNRGIK
jgi:squalene-hopene/tetraprenyl-beta-curcumene cyclase